MSKASKTHKRAQVQKWLDKADSAILNANCPVTLARIDSMTEAQLQAVLKLVSAAYSAGYHEGSSETRERVLTIHATCHVLKIEQHSQHVSVYDQFGEFVDKVHDITEARALVAKRLELKRAVQS